MAERDAVEILLVEDRDEDAEMTTRALRKSHLANQLRRVRDGAEALELLLGGPACAGGAAAITPRLVLLDLKLPKVSGLEVLARLKCDERTRAIPVVVLTSSRQEQDLVESYRLGVNSYIVKPVDFDQFLEAVRQLGLYWLLLNERTPPAT